MTVVRRHGRQRLIAYWPPYTLVGAGTSILPVRLNCPPEITCIPCAQWMLPLILKLQR
jgi:hypothetical protein